MAPLAVLRGPSMHHVVEELAQCNRSLAHLSGSDVSMIAACDGADLDTGSGEEHLVGNIDLRTIDGSLDDLPVQFVAHELDDGSPRDAFKNVIGYRRCRPFSVAEHENVCRRAFRNMTVLVEHD